MTANDEKTCLRQVSIKGGGITDSLLVIAIGAVVGTAITSKPALADEFILKDGVTVVNEEPAFDGPEHANEGAFEGGDTGTKDDAHSELRVSAEIQTGGSGGGLNIPTGKPPSPDFGVQPFTARMVRFEEFGTRPLPGSDEVYFAGHLPSSGDPRSMPNGLDLENFLESDIYPYPTVEANRATTPDGRRLTNPWETDIEEFLGHDLIDPPAEGRPPGKFWAHQRWQEFPPVKYFQSVMTGARENQGFRDQYQRHGYAHGEFAPGGLYHNTAWGNQFDGTTAGIPVKFHPDFPEQAVQDPLALWTFDGTFPPKLLNVRYGEGVLFRHYNALPIDPAANYGFGLHTITTHEHNGHNPAESDGYTNSFFFPGQFYDYRWPIQLAGHDSINTDASDEQAAFPCSNGESLNIWMGDFQTGYLEERFCESGRIPIRGDYRETMSTHWFHDHMLDFTAQNVYKGNAAMMNYYSAIDRGNEAIDDGVNLRLPSGTDLDWGNRDYDVNLLMAAKSWDDEGQLFFNVFNTDGFLGDRMTVNWIYKPYFDVRARRYRFRILNAAVSRYFKFALVTEDGERVPMHMIANDGNIMQHAIRFDGELPTQAIAERYDIIVDFSNYAPGSKLYMINLMEHKNGRGPEDESVPLEEVLSGEYRAVIEDNEWTRDPVVGKFLEFRVNEYLGEDLSMDPTEYEPGGLTMLELPSITQAELDSAVIRDFEFGRSSGTDDLPWTIKTDGGSGFNMDPRRLSAAPDLNGWRDGNSVEIWHLSTGGGWSHPIHVHFEEGQILSRDGSQPPIWEQFARKDVYRIGSEVDSSREVTFAIRFREFAGTYMEHCHNTQHEDTAMLMRWDIESPGQVAILPTPMPTWQGVGYADSHALATFRNGVGGDSSGKTEGGKGKGRNKGK